MALSLRTVHTTENKQTMKLIAIMRFMELMKSLLHVMTKTNSINSVHTRSQKRLFFFLIFIIGPQVQS